MLSPELDAIAAAVAITLALAVVVVVVVTTVGGSCSGCDGRNGCGNGGSMVLLHSKTLPLRHR